MTAPRAPADWSRLLRSLAASSAARQGSFPFEVDACVEADLGGRTLDCPASSGFSAAPSRSGASAVDLRLWHAVVRIGSPPMLPDGGPLAPGLRDQGIECWTETELCALHALDTIARRTADPALAARRDATVDWLLSEIQPDNATNLPWAVQAFVQRWCDAGDAQALLYAQAQLHACRLMLGVPDPRSALILRHAAMLLDAPCRQE